MRLLPFPSATGTIENTESKMPCFIFAWHHANLIKNELAQGFFSIEIGQQSILVPLPEYDSQRESSRERQWFFFSS